MLDRLSVLLLATATAACASGGMAKEPPDASNHVPVDAKLPGPEDAMVDAEPHVPPDAPVMPVSGSPLLLTEVVLAPSAGELIEIGNPNTTAVDLSTYYLSDSGNYFRLPAGMPTVDSADFIVKFPAGATIPAGGVITVALDTAANFTTTYGTAPTFAINGGTMTTVVANGTPSLTNSGEPIILFTWDGTSDLVRDADILLAGAPTATNALTTKNGVAIDGPDANTATTSYANDARTIAPQAATPASAKSTKRILPEAGHETQDGTGNGLTGDDETSENTAVTWDATFTAPTPGTVPTGVLP